MKEEERDGGEESKISRWKLVGGKTGA